MSTRNGLAFKRNTQWPALKAGEVGFGMLDGQAVLRQPDGQMVAIGQAQNNLSALTAPTVNDDSTAGYSVGSKWYDVAGEEAYSCLSAAPGAAVWINTTLDPSELHAVAVSGSYNDLSNVPLDWNGSEYDTQADIVMGSYSLVGSAISLDISNGYILDTGGYTTLDVGAHTLHDSNGNSVCDFSMSSGDGVVIFNEDVEIESGTLHLYYLKDDPMNPASFIVDLSSGYFNLASGVLQVNGASGANFGPGMPTTMTIVDGIVTAAS